MIKRILVAVDGSPASTRASEVALELAQPADAEVTFLYGSAEHMERLFIDNPFTSDSDERLAAEVPVLGGAARLAAARGVRSRLELVGEEAPAEAVILTVISTAVARDIELIVVGSRGLGAVARTVLGSVSEGLLHQTTIPTLIVHPEPDQSD